VNVDTDHRAERRAAALAQPNAKERSNGAVKFACPACVREGYDDHKDNAVYFPDTDKWSCAWAHDTALGRAHWDAIGAVLGVFQRQNGSDASEATTADPPPRVRFRSGSALDATPITYLVEDMLPAGMLGALGGKDGMGKTLIGMEIIKCVLTGQKLFGRFAVQHGTVYALFLDDPEFLVRERLHAMGILDHPHLHVATEADVDMADPRAMLTALIALLKTAEPRPTFIFVDALYLFIPSGGASDQGNSAGAMAPVIEAFNQVTRETGSALLLVAHDNKAGSDIAGSYAIRAGLKSILRMLLPPAIAKKVAKGDEEARETPERMLQLNKLKTGRPASWYLRLEGPGQWTFHGDARAYRKATLPGRVLESLWGHGDSTVEEIAKDLKARPFEVRRACVTLYLADQITKGERPREDGKPGRDATTYGPKAPAVVHGTDSSKQVDGRKNGTDRLGERVTAKQPDTAIPNLSVPFDPSPRAREAIRPTTPTQSGKTLCVPESPDDLTSDPVAETPLTKGDPPMTDQPTRGLAGLAASAPLPRGGMGLKPLGIDDPVPWTPRLFAPSTARPPFSRRFK
jgi:hypothetical protein